MGILYTAAYYSSHVSAVGFWKARYLSSHGNKIGNAGQTRWSPPTKNPPNVQQTIESSARLLKRGIVSSVKRKKKKTIFQYGKCFKGSLFAHSRSLFLLFFILLVPPLSSKIGDRGCKKERRRLLFLLSEQCQRFCFTCWWIIAL